MIEEKLLSIVLANYNHALYLPKAIDSLLSQTCLPSEILIVDDASTDTSWEVLQSYVKKNPLIRALRNEKNQGVIATSNRGIREAKGRYIHTMGADDFRLPGFVEKTLAPLLENPEIGLSCSDFGYIKGPTNEGPIHTDRLIPELKKTEVFPAKTIVSIFQRTHFWIPGHTAIYRKDLALRYQLQRPELKFYCDWFKLHQIALHHGAAYVPETLSVWWIHTQSYSNQLLDNRALKKDVYRTLLAILDREPESKVLFQQSTLLYEVCTTLFKELYYRPNYWPFFWPLWRKSLLGKWRRLLGQKLSHVG